MNNNYPAGSNTPDAPWNEVDPEVRSVEVEITLTLTKRVNLKVSDYELIEQGVDKEGVFFEDIDFSNCDIDSAVKEQVDLPKNWIIEDIDTEIVG